MAVHKLFFIIDHALRPLFCTRIQTMVKLGLFRLSRLLAHALTRLHNFDNNNGRSEADKSGRFRLPNIARIHTLVLPRNYAM